MGEGNRSGGGEQRSGGGEKEERERGKGGTGKVNRRSDGVRQEE